MLIELHLTLGKPVTAFALLNYIESQFTFTTDSSKSALGGEQSQNQKHEGLIKPNTRTVATLAAGKEQKKDSIDVATDAFGIKLLKYKLWIYAKTLQLKLCKREWKTLVSLGMPSVNIHDIEIIFCDEQIDTRKFSFRIFHPYFHESKSRIFKEKLQESHETFKFKKKWN